MTLLDYSKKVVLGDITVRDGLQHEEKFIPTDAKLWLAEQLVLAGFKRIEVTNFGNPRGMPQFKDADELMKRIRGSKKIGNLLEDVEITTVTIRERAVERAIQAREEGWGPDRILFMVSTSEAHHQKNSGLSLEEYWKMCEAYIPKAHDAGMKVCGTVSTIWGCPIAGPTELEGTDLLKILALEEKLRPGEMVEVRRGHYRCSVRVALHASAGRGQL